VSFVFEFGLPADEHARASRLINLRRPVMKMMIGGSVVIALIATAAFARAIAWNGYDPPFLLALGWCLPVGVVVGLIVGPLVQVRALRRKNRGAGGPHVYTLNDAGLQMSAPGATATLTWDNIVEVFESREFILFYFAATWAQVLPKRAVRQDLLPSLRTALEHWVGAKAHVIG
jgi:hypothetical protein